MVIRQNGWLWKPLIEMDDLGVHTPLGTPQIQLLKRFYGFRPDMWRYGVTTFKASDLGLDFRQN